MAERPAEHEGMGRDGAERRGLLSSAFSPFLRKSAGARPRAVRFPKKIAEKLRSRARAHTHERTRTYPCQSLIPFPSKRKLWTLYLPLAVHILKHDRLQRTAIMYYAFATPNTRACACTRA